MGLFGDFSNSGVGQNLLGTSPQQQRNTLLGISQAFAAPKNRGESTFGNVLGAVSQSSAARQVNSEKRMGQVLSIMPKGMNFKNISPESKSMIEDYLRTGDQTLLMSIDFGTAAPTASKAVSVFGKQATDLGFVPGTEDFSAKVTELMTTDAKGKGPLVTIDNRTNTADKELTKKNVARLAELQVGSGSRELSLTKAEGFLKAFTSGKANSGAGRKMLSFSPFGTYTSQGEFDEQLDSFSEIAARSKLKAVGEIRPTDADVKGMKESLFGIGKDEDVNIQLLQDFIQEQTSLQDEYKGLTSANEAGTIAGFQSIAGTMSPREADPVKITGWFRGISPDSPLFDDIVGKMTGAQREILFQEIQAGRF